MSSKLKCLVVADPLSEVAQLTADACERLADERLVATNGAAALELVRNRKPEVLIVSLELTKPETVDVVAKLYREQPNLLIVATYRELAVPMMEKLGRSGVDDFVAQPVDATEVFRAATRRFQQPFRRHDRHSCTLEVYRADGVMIGRTRDLSEGGMFIDALHPVKRDESMLVDVALNDGKEQRLRVRSRVLHVDGEAPTPVTARVQFERLWGPEHRRLVDYLQQLGKSSPLA